MLALISYLALSVSWIQTQTLFKSSTCWVWLLWRILNEYNYNTIQGASTKRNSIALHLQRRLYFVKFDSPQKIYLEIESQKSTAWFLVYLLWSFELFDQQWFAASCEYLGGKVASQRPRIRPWFYQTSMLSLQIMNVWNSSVGLKRMKMQS